MQVSGTARKEQIFSPFDISCMKRALVLARRGEGRTSPNPIVGAVLAKDGRIISEGWHRRYGEAHAEARTLQAALDNDRSPVGADLYCNLEPCCYTAPEKRQPPCTDLIIKSRIKRVYIANLDPNPKVNGGGVAVLQKAGIAVSVGLCAAEGEELNRAFFTFHRLRRPYIHLKLAQTLDGKVAAPDGSSRWISDEAARRITHRLRSRYDAVLVGSGTARADDPELTVRLVKGRNPLRIVLDSRLTISETAKLLNFSDPEKTIIVYSDDKSPARTQKAEKLRTKGAELIAIPSSPPLPTPHSPLPLKAVLEALAKRGVQSALVEGGAGICSSFLREGLWDRLSLVIAPVILGGGVSSISELGIDSMAQALRFGKGTFRRVGGQTLFQTDREQEVLCLQG